MKKFTKMLALGAAFGMTYSAGAITTDGDWSDWFTYNVTPVQFAQNNWYEGSVVLNNANIRSFNDEEGPTPGGGGQRYDIEQIFYTFTDADLNDPNSGGTLHIGLVTGFPPQGIDADNLYAGDMFIDLGNSGSFTHAIAVSTRATFADQARFGQVWGNLGWAEEGVVTQFSSSEPYRVIEGLPGALAVGATNVVIGQVAPHRYFYEIELALDGGGEDLLTGQGGGVGLHWTMQCGNDVIDVIDDQPLVPNNPVPEPSTFALLGMGVLGAALRRKFAA